VGSDLQHATVQQLYPLEITMEAVNNPEIALTIFNVGMLSSGAHVLDKKWYRHLPGMTHPGLRNLYERAILLPVGLAATRPFYSTYTMSGQTYSERMVDITAVNAAIIGKHALWSDVELLEPGYAVSELPSLKKLLTWTREVRKGMRPVVSMNAHETYNIQVDRSVPMSYDGDPTILDKNRLVTVGAASSPIHVLTTDLEFNT